MGRNNNEMFFPLLFFFTIYVTNVTGLHKALTNNLRIKKITHIFVYMLKTYSKIKLCAINNNFYKNKFSY